MVSTHLPLCEPEFAVAPSLGDNALVLLERAAHDARCDGNVAVVAVWVVSHLVLAIQLLQQGLWAMA